MERGQEASSTAGGHCHLATKPSWDGEGLGLLPLPMILDCVFMQELSPALHQYPILEKSSIDC